VTFDPETFSPIDLLGQFTTSLWLPHYRAGVWGGWSLRVAFLAAGRGYWGQTYATLGSAVLSGPVHDGNATWMSIVPMEIESQEIGIAAARGHTVVLGLGMGWAAANVALNPAVERVTVIERDPDVITLIGEQGVFGQLLGDARAKVTIVNADAFDWRPDSPVNSLQGDIWAKVVEPGKWSDVHRLQANIGASSLYFWGQEMELYRLACREAGGIATDLSDADVERLAAQTGLPLVLSRKPGLAARITAGAAWWTPNKEGWWDA
jgi:hypothetical protein